MLIQIGCKFQITPREKRCKIDISYYFSEKTTMTIAAETILREEVIGKV
jgi:hypothetical protein